MEQRGNEGIESRIDIKSYDIDLAGHVNNIVYVRWLEDLRVALFQKISPLQNLFKEGLYPVVFKLDITYKKALKFNDEVIG